MAEWMRDEEERLKKIRSEVEEWSRIATEQLQQERGSWVKQMETDRAQLYAQIDSERQDLVHNLELQRSNLDRWVEQERDAMERKFEEAERQLRMEIDQERKDLKMTHGSVSVELEQLHLERVKLEQERQDLVQQREEAEKEWKEIKNDIQQLHVQGEKLREQRESLHLERQGTIREMMRLQKLRDELKEAEGSMSIQASELPATAEQEVVSLHQQGIQVSQQVTETPIEPVMLASTAHPSRRMVARTPGRLSWLRKCASRASQLFSSASDVKAIAEAQEAETLNITASRPGDEADPLKAVNQPSSSFNQSQLAQVISHEDDSLHVDAANTDLPPYGEQHDVVGIGEEASESSRQGLHEEPAVNVATPATSIDTQTGTKRRRQNSGSAQDPDAEIESETGSRTPRRKRLRNSQVEDGSKFNSALNNRSSLMTTPGAKRYNFRPTTM